MSFSAAGFICGISIVEDGPTIRISGGGFSRIKIVVEI
jgi:hypothetical protein